MPAAMFYVLVHVHYYGDRNPVRIQDNLAISDDKEDLVSFLKDQLKLKLHQRPAYQDYKAESKESRQFDDNEEAHYWIQALPQTVFENEEEEYGCECEDDGESFEELARRVDSAQERTELLLQAIQRVERMYNGQQQYILDLREKFAKEIERLEKTHHEKVDKILAEVKLLRRSVGPLGPRT